MPGSDPRPAGGEAPGSADVFVFMEEYIMNPCLMQQVTYFDIADGGPAAAGVEKHGKERAIANIAYGVGWGSVEKPAGLLGRKTWCAAASRKIIGWPGLRSEGPGY